MNSTLILGVGAIGFALVFRSQSHDLPEQAQRLPVLLIWVVIALAVLMIIEELLKRRLARRNGGAVKLDDDEPLPPINWHVLVIFGAAAVAYVTLIPYLGYLVITPIFLIGGLLVSRTLSPLKAVLVGAVATGVVWAIFVGALSLPIPLLPSLN